MQWVTTLCPLAHSPSHPHSLTLSDDENEDVPKSEYSARYHMHNDSPPSFRPSFAATSLTGHFGTEIFRIIQNFPNLLALLSNLDDFRQKISHRNTVASTKMWPFPLRIGVILKPLQEEIAPTRVAVPLETRKSRQAGGRTRNERRGTEGMRRDVLPAGKHSLQWKTLKTARHFNVAPGLNPRATGWI